MCSRLWIGSASMPSRPSKLVTVVLMRSRSSFAVFHHGLARRGERFEDRQRHAGIAARRVDGHVHFVTQQLGSDRATDPNRPGRPAR